MSNDESQVGALEFEGSGDGMLRGFMPSDTPVVVAQWRGSGIRTGSIVFKAVAIDCRLSSVPVTVLLSIP